MRLYSNIAQDSVLTVDPGVSGTVINTVATTGWPSPSSGDSALGSIDFGTAGVEVFEYTGLTATTYTGVTRGVDGTTASAHNVGATVRHVASGYDLQGMQRYGESSLAALQTGLWYSPNGITSLTTQAAASGVLRESQHVIPARTHIVGIGAEVTTLGAGVLRFAIYRDNGSGKPSTLVLDCGTVSGSTTGFKSITIDLWLPRGLYHAAMMSEGASITTRAGNVHMPPARLPMLSTTSTSVATGYQASGVSTGSAPNPFPSGMVLSNSMPYVLLLVG